MENNVESKHIKKKYNKCKSHVIRAVNDLPHFVLNLLVGLMLPVHYVFTRSLFASTSQC